MKKVLTMLLLVLVTSTAWATAPADMRFGPVKDEPVYQKWLEGSLIGPATEKAATSNILLVKHQALAGQFFVLAEQLKFLPKGAEDKAVYVQNWLRINKLQPGYSNAKAFREHIIKNGELRLLTEADLVGNGTGAPVAAAPAITTATVAATPTPQVSKEVAKLARELTRLKGEVKSTKAAVINGDEKLAGEMAEKIGVLNGQLLAMIEQVSVLPSVAEVEGLKGQIKEVLDDVKNIRTAQTEMAEEISNLWLAVAGSGLIGVAALLFGFGHSRRIKTVQQQVADTGNSVTDVNTKVSKLSARVSGLENDVYGIYFSTKDLTPAALTAMRIKDTSLILDIQETGSGNVVCQLKIVCASETSVDVYGISRNKDRPEPFVSVPIGSVVRTIYRAHKDHRMVGIPAASVTQLAAA